MSETFPQAFGRYQLLERLAMGGMAELFLAEVPGAHGFAKTVVIKRILPRLVADKKFTEMFIAEAKLTARLAHPKIAQTLELANENKQLFIVMEYIDGLDVLAMLRECAHRQVRVPAEISVYIVKEVLDALDFAHKLGVAEGKDAGIVHRDVSPSNILLSKRGDVKLVDFGIAHAVAQEDQTKSGTLKGKYGYMSPEQVLGQNVSARSDVFASGIVLAEMLMGRRLFAAANELDVLLMVRDVDLRRLTRFGEHIDEQLASMLRWALRKDPGDRYTDAATFRDALDEWLFEKRHRIGPPQLASIVDSLYDDALVRRKQGLQAKAADSMRQRAVAANPLALGSATPVSEQDSSVLDLAVPTGLAPDDRVVGAEPSAVIEVGLDADGELIMGELAEGSRAEDSLTLEPAEASNAELVLELGTSDTATSETPQSFEDGSGEASFDSISAAVASVSPADPASKDFDDSDVSGVEAGGARRIPTGEYLVQSEPPKPPSLEPDGEEAQSVGTLDERPALAVLYQSTRDRVTGKMVLSFGGVRKEIYFKRGMPEYVSSNIASELLGAYLVRMEVVSSGELDMALAVMPHFGGKLGDTLVGLGLMKPLEVFRHLTRQVRSKIIEVCTWTQGRYEWYPDARCPRQAFPLDLDPLEVYGAGAIAMPREAIETWATRYSDVRLVATESAVAVPELFQVAGLRTYQRSVNGTRSLGEMVAEAAADDQGLHELRLLFLLANTNLLVASASA